MQAYTVYRESDISIDPFSLFKALSKDVSEAVLLESKDGNGKNNVASYLFLQNALEITGRASCVTIRVLTENGWQALTAMKGELEKIATYQETETGAELTFSQTLPDGDDITRIKAVYPSDVIRIFTRKWNLGSDDKKKRIVMPGTFSYDYLDCIEKLPAPKKDILAFPDYCFYLPEVVVTMDHVSHQARVCIHGYHATSYDAVHAEDAKRAEAFMETVAAVAAAGPSADGGIELPREGAFDVSRNVETDLSDEQYADVVTMLKQNIVNGDVFQIVPSRTFTMPCDEPLAAYGVLRELNPSPYLFMMKTKDFTLFGASPETSVKVGSTPLRVSICPIAGTRKRGFMPDGRLDLDLDGRLEAELKLNEKELAEHMMLVDLARNDVARVTKPGSRYVPNLLKAERYSHVMHLESVVQGELRDDLDALHAYLASANMGTLVGSPKIKAASLLRQHEVDKRGAYGGAIGYFTSDGEMDTAIVIRSAVVKEGVARVRAGAGVVFDSDPQAEAEETRAKASAVLKAIAIANEVSL